MYVSMETGVLLESLFFKMKKKDGISRGYEKRPDLPPLSLKEKYGTLLST